MPKKILIATIMRPQGETGVQTHFRAFMGYLKKEGLESELLTPYSAKLWQVYPIFGLRIFVNILNSTVGVWWYRYWHALFLQQALSRRLKDGAPCTIYAQCPLSAHAALVARVSDSQRIFLVVHFNISQADEWVGKGLISGVGWLFKSIRAFESSVLPRMDGLIFVSDFMRRELITRIASISKVPMAVVPNFLADPGLPEVDMNATGLINIGTLEARKNQTYLLDIVAELRNIGHSMQLTLIGDGPDRQELEQKVKTLNIESLVSFAGYRSNASDYIYRHCAYVHVAVQENLPITLLEAMARKRPVFAALVGGIPEIFGSTVSGLGLPLNDAISSARIIADAMTNSEWVVAAGNAGRERFLSEYCSDVAAKRLLHFFESESGIC